MSFWQQNTVFMIGYIRKHASPGITEWALDYLWQVILLMAFEGDRIIELKECPKGFTRTLDYQSNSVYIQPCVPSCTTYKFDIGGEILENDDNRHQVLVGLALEYGCIRYPPLRCRGRVLLNIRVDTAKQEIVYKYRDFATRYARFNLGTLIHPFRIWIGTEKVLMLNSISQRGEKEWLHQRAVDLTKATKRGPSKKVSQKYYSRRKRSTIVYVG